MLSKCIGSEPLTSNSSMKLLFKCITGQEIQIICKEFLVFFFSPPNCSTADTIPFKQEGGEHRVRTCERILSLEGMQPERRRRLSTNATGGGRMEVKTKTSKRVETKSRMQY